MNLPTEQKFLLSLNNFPLICRRATQNNELPGRLQLAEDSRRGAAAELKGSDSIRNKEKNAAVSPLFTLGLFVSFLSPCLLKALKYMGGGVAGSLKNNVYQ